MARVEPANLARDRVCMQSRAVDDARGADRRRRVAAYLYDEASVDRFDRFDGRMERADGAVAFRVALQREHQLMAVDNTRLRREHGFDTLQRRFERLRFLAADTHQIEHAVFLAARHDAFELGNLVARSRDEQFAAALVRHAAFGAVVVQHLAATHAQCRLERTTRIVDARVYHFAVAGTRADADGSRRL